MDLSIRVPLRPELNFRDLGGYETSRGERVRRGLVFRSAHLCDADHADRGVLDTLAIRTVCDLRAPEEAAARPSPLADIAGVSVLAVGVIGGRAIGDPAQSILEYGFEEVTAEHVADFYRVIVDQQPEVFGHVMTACADAAQHSVVIHCSAGKDRTGIAAALLLSVLGVPDEAVVSDYELTNQLWSPAQMERARPVLEEAGLAFEAVQTYFLAPAVAMHQTLRHLRETHGSIEAYLTGPAGVPPATLDDLRGALIE